MTTFARIGISAILLCACGNAEQVCTDGYKRAASNIEIGSELYYDYGAGKQFAGTVHWIGDHDFGEGKGMERGLRVQLTDGGIMWRRRNPIILDEKWLVKC